MLQQPAGRSPGICRRRSSRLASDRASAAMWEATVAAKCAKLSAAVVWSAIARSWSSTAARAGSQSSMACAGGRSAAWKPACVQGAGKHKQNYCKAYTGAARRLTAHLCLARPFTRARPVQVSTTGSRAMRHMRTSVRCGRMACIRSCTRLNATPASSAVQGARRAQA